jgi:membrane dipeptidase
MNEKQRAHDSGLSAGDRAVAFTRDTFVLDALSLYYILDEPYAERCLEGGVNAANVTFAVEENWDETLEAIERGLEKIERHPLLALAVTADEILAARNRGQLAVIMGTQGASMVGTCLWRIGLLWRLGLRFIGLAYTAGNLLADGCGERRNGGLTFLGQEFIAAVNDWPMILDLSHCGHQTRAEAVELSRAPVCTHSNAYAVNPNDRNTKDETANTIADKGGVLGICGLPRSVKAQDPALEDMLEHCDHYRKLIGFEHVGIGLDFTEAYKESGTILPESIRWRTWRPDIFGSVDDFQSQSYPSGLESIRLLPNLTQGLFDRGCTEEQAAAILGGNWLRTFREFIG